jgi:hypothetical protein
VVETAASACRIRMEKNMLGGGMRETKTKEKRGWESG